MPNVQIVVTGLDDVVKAFNALPNEVISSVENELRPILRTLKGKLANYPPERPGQKYKRTGNLGRGWTGAQERYVTRHYGFDVLIENSVGYSGDVQGDNQGSYFAGRWDPASAILFGMEDEIQHGVESGVDQAIKRLGL